MYFHSAETARPGFGMDSMMVHNLQPGISEKRNRCGPAARDEIDVIDGTAPNGSPLACLISFRTHSTALMLAVAPTAPTQILADHARTQSRLDASRASCRTSTTASCDDQETIILEKKRTVAFLLPFIRAGLLSAIALRAIVQT